MPRSKRDKKISLTKTERKGLEWKQHIIDDIKSCCENYPNIFLFSVQNMRNNLLKELRTDWKHSRFFFGKNRIMQIGLGRTDSDELYPNLHKLSNCLVGQCGLLFTKKSKKYVLDWFEKYEKTDYAKSGFVATETVTLNEGPLEDFAHSIEPHLRSLGLPTKLNRGIVTLYKDYTVCEKNKVLNPEQARILKLINMPMAKFALLIKCCWTKKDGYEQFVEDLAIAKKPKDKKSDDESEEEMEQDDEDNDDDSGGDDEE